MLSDSDVLKIHSVGYRGIYCMCLYYKQKRNRVNGKPILNYGYCDVSSKNKNIWCRVCL